MKIYYFVHIVGRDQGNSGIPRVSRNLGKALLGLSEVVLVPVRWDATSSAIVHVEPAFLETMNLYNGPVLQSGGAAGQPIHLDPEMAEWLLVPEVTHLHSHDTAYPSFQFPLLPGYARQHGLKIAAIFHDAIPLTHFGEESSRDTGSRDFMIYTLGLSECDVILPVSRASAIALTSLFGRYGVAPIPSRILVEILLPEELIDTECLKYLTPITQQNLHTIEFCMWGAIYPHKNYLLAMEAFNILCRKRPDLDLVLHHIGQVSGNCVERAKRLVRRSHGRIKLHGFATDQDLIAIVKRSRASVFVSKAEGYGLPLAESLWLGLPCITSSIAPMAEIAAGGGALLVDPTNVESIALGIEQIATDDELYKRLQNELQHRSFRTWIQYGEQVLEVIRRFDASKSISEKSSIAYTSHSRTALDRMEILHLNIADMLIPSEYFEAHLPVMVNGKITYIREAHLAAQHDVICFGPYITIGRGRYLFSFEGFLKGECRVRITSGGGKVVHREVQIDSLEVDIDLIAEDDLEQLEILFIKTPELEYLHLDSIIATRFYL